MGVLHSVLRPVAFVALLAALTTGSTSAASAVDDTTAPVFTAQSLQLNTSDWTEYSSWWSSDDLSGVDYSQARWRTKTIGGTWGPWHLPATWSALPGDASISKHFRVGHKYQIQARVFDKAGNHTVWTSVGGGIRPAN